MRFLLYDFSFSGKDDDIRSDDMDKKQKEKMKSRLTNMQEFLYAKDFRKADRAGYSSKKS